MGFSRASDIFGLVPPCYKNWKFFREAAQIVIFLVVRPRGWGGVGGKGRTTKKSELFLKVEKKSEKNVNTLGRRDRTLVVRPLKKLIFFGGLLYIIMKAHQPAVSFNLRDYNVRLC